MSEANVDSRSPETLTRLPVGQCSPSASFPARRIQRSTPKAFASRQSNISPSRSALRAGGRRPIQQGFSWPIALIFVVLIMAAVVVLVFLRLESWPARTATQGTAELERLGKDLRSVFIDIAHLQPRITINNRVYMEQSTPTSELAVLFRRIEVEHELQHTWVGSSKRVKLHGTFAVKAGFDLRQNLSVDVRPDEIVAQLPHAQILGVEQEQLEVLAFENGFWNRISAADVQTELTALPQLARQKAAESDLTTEAERTLQQQLDARIHARQPLRLVFTGTSTKE